MVSFISSSIESFIAKYTLRAQTLNAYAPVTRQIKPENSTSAQPAPQADSVDVSPEGQALQQAGPHVAKGNAADQSAEAQGQSATEPTPEQPSESGEPSVPAEAAPAPIMQRVRAEAEIRVRMSFSMRTIANAVERLENGELSTAEAFEQTRIALSVRMSAHGQSVTETELGQGEALNPQTASQKLKFTQRAAARYGVESKDFELRGFFREALKIRERMSVEQQGTHQRVVRQFALRYRFDAKFSLEHLQRFNSNTEAVNEAAPDETGGFLAASGALAQSGSNDMVSAFFDAVESYLNHAHDQLTESVGYFVDAASSELGGLSEGMVSDLEGLLTGRIDAFFGRVEGSLAQLESRYLPQVTEQPPPESEPQSPPAITGDEKAALAVA